MVSEAFAEKYVRLYNPKSHLYCGKRTKATGFVTKLRTLLLTDCHRPQAPAALSVIPLSKMADTGATIDAVTMLPSASPARPRHVAESIFLP